MKKYIFAIALAATMLAGCQKEEFSAPAAKQDDGKTVLTATVNNGTRSTVSEDGMFAWATDDVIGAMTPEGKFAQFNLTGGSGTYSATFTSVDDNVKVEKVAVFPMEDAKALDGKKLTVTLPERFNYVAERTYSPMMAVISGNDVSKLEFKHLAGLLTVTFNHVPADAAYFYVTSPTNKIKGDFEIEDYTSEGACIKTGPVPSGSSKSSIWMDLPEEPFNGPTTFYLPLPVGEYDSLTVGFLDADYYYCGDDAKKVYEDFKVERCDMRTASLANKVWDIIYDQRGLKSGREDGRDVFIFNNIPGKWQYAYKMHIEYNGYGYNADDMAIINEKAASNKASSTPKVYDKDMNIIFSPFPAKQTVHIFAFQIDDDMNPTGEYMHREWTPIEKETSSEGFNKWLGTWLASGKDEAGNDSTYTLTITKKANDELYDIAGWAHSATKLQGWYDETTGGLIIKTYLTTCKSIQKSSGVEYQCKGGFFGATAKGFQTANSTLCTGTIDESGTMATLEGYTYYTNSPFVTMGMYWWSFELNPETGRPLKGWYSKKRETLIHFPVTLTKVEVD